jgi:hypothetical protein
MQCRLLVQKVKTKVWKIMGTYSVGSRISIVGQIITTKEFSF